VDVYKTSEQGHCKVYQGCVLFTNFLALATVALCLYLSISINHELIRLKRFVSWFFYQTV
jgi:hypothetical protein